MSARILLLSGSFEYDSEESLVLLRDYLCANTRWSCRVLAWRSEDDEVSLGSLDEEADGVVLFTRRLPTAGVELGRLQRWCRDGRPVVALRTASHGFQNWLELDSEILGGNYQGHYSAGVVTQVTVAPGAEGHPVLEEVEPFAALGALYRNTPLAADAVPLLRGTARGRCEPVAWTCERAGRAFTTSLGHPRDFWELDFLRLVRNGIAWSLGDRG